MAGNRLVIAHSTPLVLVINLGVCISRVFRFTLQGY
jgi:hypothetical protein